MHIILYEEFCFVQVVFGSMVKFQFLAQFPVDNLSHPFMLSLVLFWRKFAAFAYNMINDFVFLAI